jgi:hypothetical protein
MEDKDIEDKALSKQRQDTGFVVVFVAEAIGR